VFCCVFFFIFYCLIGWGGGGGGQGSGIYFIDLKFSTLELTVGQRSS